MQSSYYHDYSLDYNYIYYRFFSRPYRVPIDDNNDYYLAHIITRYEPKKLTKRTRNRINIALK